MSCFIARAHNVHLNADCYILSGAISLDRDWVRKFCLPHLKGLRKIPHAGVSRRSQTNCLITGVDYACKNAFLATTFGIVCRGSDKYDL